MKKYLSDQFELSRGGGAHNVRPMEGLRGFAVFLVFLVHYTTLVKPWVTNLPTLALASAIHTIGNTGVDLFFVLSGYLIYGSLIERPQNFFKFMSRRIARIYPTFTVVFAIYVTLSLAMLDENKIPANFREGLIYLVQNFLLLPGLFPIEPMITVAWSLSYEMFYYLVIPLMIGLLKLRVRTSAWRVGFFLILAAAIVVSCGATGGLIRLVMFISGVLLCETLKNGKSLPKSNFFGAIALITGLLATLIPLGGWVGTTVRISVLFVSYYIFCWACFQDSRGLLPTVFSWTPLRWLGNMSYSYYLLHGLALNAAFLALAAVVPEKNNQSEIFWALLPIMFVTTLIPSAVLFLAVERRFSLTPQPSKIGLPNLTHAN